MRRLLVLVTVPMLILAACGGGGSKSSSGTSAGEKVAGATPCPLGSIAKAATKPVKITMWHAMTRANEETLTALTDRFNASQTDVHVDLVNQTSYEDTLTKFKASLGGGQLPDLMQIQDVDQQLVIDSGAILPAQACIDAAKYDQTDVLPRIRRYFTVDGKQWAMPFSISNPILYYNRKAFSRAGLDPDKPPTTLDELRTASQKLIASGGVQYGLALKLDPWYFEEWQAMAGQLYADHGNGREGRATKVLFDGAQGQAIATWMSGMAKDKLAEGVPRSGFDNLLALGNEVAAMTMDTSAALGTIVQVLGSGQFPNVELGAAPLPGPVASGGGGGTVVAGSALYLVSKSPPERQEAAWRFATFLASAASQSTWAAGTGYLPIRTGAATLAPVTDVWKATPQFRIAYDQLQRGSESAASAGPNIGAMEPVRDAVVHLEESIFQGGDALAGLKDAASKANAAIKDYEGRVGG